MKHIVVEMGLDEFVVHPRGSFEKHIQLGEESAKELLSEQDSFINRPCPACESLNKRYAFEKFGYHYWQCKDCTTLYISPCPNEELLQKYFTNSPLSDFQKTEEFISSLKRLEPIWKWEIQTIEDLAYRVGENFEYADYGTRYSQRLDYFKKAHPKWNIGSIKPLGDIEYDIAKRGTSTPRFDIITNFGVAEHTFSLKEMLKSMWQLIKPGGYLRMGSRSASGFEIQLLWEKAKVYPLEHINLVSVEGIMHLVKETGFIVEELSTPGQLDLQIVERQQQPEQNLGLFRFLNYIFQHRGEDTRKSFQEFLQENLLSSHLQILCRKPEKS